MPEIPSPEDVAAAQFSAFASLAEATQPFIEFAEGQKSMLIGRGWSAGAAEQYSLVLLSGLTRMYLRTLGGS